VPFQSSGIQFAARLKPCPFKIRLLKIVSNP
jgi:hypothetical protein